RSWPKATEPRRSVPPTTTTPGALISIFSSIWPMRPAQPTTPTLTAPLVFLPLAAGGSGAGLGAGAALGAAAAGAFGAGALAGAETGFAAAGCGAGAGALALDGFSAFADFSFDFKLIGFFGGAFTGGRPDFLAFIPRNPASRNY